MLQKKNSSPSLILIKGINRSKSTFSNTEGAEKLISGYRKKYQNTGSAMHRAQSALKLSRPNPRQFQGNEGNKNSMLPKVSKSRLCLGKMHHPQYILAKEARSNPWGRPAPINEQIIAKKGLMQAINMGMLPKTADFTELLNNKYQIIKQAKRVEQGNVEDQVQMFVTNPDFQPDEQQKKIQQDEKKEKTDRKKKTKKKISRKKQPKKQELRIEDFLPKKIILFLDNAQVLRNEEYFEQLKKAKLQGNETEFKEFLRQIEDFAERFRLKKFQFVLDLNFNKKMTDLRICHLIQNYKAKGIYKAMIGGKQVQNRQTIRMMLYRFRYKTARKNLQKIENIKKFFKVKKFYEEMAQKRVDYLKFKFGSFVETQRRYLQEITQNQEENPGKNKASMMKYLLEIHIPLIDAGNAANKQSYYKLAERNNIQLTRLFSTNPQHLILITLGDVAPQLTEEYFAPWTKLINFSRGYHPKLALVPINPGIKLLNAVGDFEALYYGLNPKNSVKIKKCIQNAKSKKKNIEIGLLSSGFPNAIVKMAELYEVKVCGGSFITKNIELIRMEEEEQAQKQEQQQERVLEQQQQEQLKNQQQQSLPKEQNTKNSEKIRKIDVIKAKSREINEFILINEYFNDKINTKMLFQSTQNISAPFSLSYHPPSSNMQEQTIKQFMLKFSMAIITKKEVNSWVFKLRKQGRFSRGIGILEIDSLKIVKDKKKKEESTEEDITELALILKSIIQDKIHIPQNSLHDRKQFITKFFTFGGYIQEYIEGCQSCCIFGNLHPNGEYEHLGTYDKIYTDDTVNCAATYPSQYITQNQLILIEQFCRTLFAAHKIYGKITFEMLYCKKNEKFYMIDLLPSLQQYSSFYYLYKKYFERYEQEEEMNIIKNYKKTQELFRKSSSTSNPLKKQPMFSNFVINLKRKVIYCPFIDNNGNKFESFEDFQEAAKANKLKFNEKNTEGVQFLYLNLKERVPDTLSIAAFGSNTRKAFKFCLDALNFLVQNGEKANKFDKKVQRRKYDCIFINDIIWKLREIKKGLDNLELANQKNLKIQQDRK